MGVALAQVPQWARVQLMHDRVRASSSPADLRLPNVNIIHVRRCLPVHPRHITRQAALLGKGFRVKMRADTRAPSAAATTLTGTLEVPEVREWLQEDAEQLIRLFGTELGYSSVSAKLEVLGGTPCPRFHADHVGVRLLVTYCGPGTVYVENRHARRQWLWAGPGGVAVASADAAAARQAAAGDLLFLKGHAAPGNYGMGAVHRSPDLGLDLDLNLEGRSGARGDSYGDGGGIGYGGVGGGGRGAGEGEATPLRLLLTVDDSVVSGPDEDTSALLVRGAEACKCGEVHAA